MKIHPVHLRDYSTLRIGGEAFAMPIKNEDELLEALEYAQTHSLTPHISGEGSNSIYRDGHLSLLVIKNEISGFSIVSEDEKEVVVDIGAGENWDSVVERAVDNGWSGIEALSAIPGSSGAAPVQNIGAYGTEMSSVLEEVRAYNIAENTWYIFTPDECEFSYRNSIFKKHPETYCITRVRLKLSKASPSIPIYRDVQNYFSLRDIENPTLKEIRNAITEIRWAKLPRPEELSNCGSFFTNPVVSKEKGEEFRKEHPSMPQWDTEEGSVKLSAGWLIEHAVGKGVCQGDICTYEKNALILINKGESTFADLTSFVEEIQMAVSSRFGISLEQEPQVIGISDEGN